MQVKMDLTLDFLLNNTWSGGYETLDTVIEHGKGQELIDLLDELYYESTIDMIDLNDYLWFSRAEVFEHLGIEE